MTRLSSVHARLRFIFTLAATVSAFAAFLPTPARADSLGFSLADDGSGSGLSVEVQDNETGAPLPDALVTVSGGIPAATYFDVLAGRWLFTDPQGNAFFPPLGSPATVTVYKNGYAALTLVGVPSPKLTIHLKKLESSTPDVIVSGTVGGWRGFRKPVFMGLVFKSMSAFDLLHFNMGSVVSPLKDTIDIWGERKIPSNFVMPSQDIPIFIGSAHVDKTDYRLPLADRREATLAVVQGQMDSGDLISIGMGGKPDPTALNKFQFDKIGLSPSFVTGGNMSMNVDANLSLSVAHEVTVKAPPFNSDVMVAAVTDLTGDRKSLIPTDIRTAVIATRGRWSLRAVKPVSLKSTASPLGVSRGLVTVALTRDLKRLSGIITDQPGSTVAVGDFLDAAVLADAQTLPAQIKFRAPKLGLGAAVVESSVQNGEIIKTFPVWTVYTFPGAGEITVQTAAMPLQAEVKRYSVTQLEFDAAFDERNVDGRGVMTRLGRFARSSAKIGK